MFQLVHFLACLMAAAPASAALYPSESAQCEPILKGTGFNVSFYEYPVHDPVGWQPQFFQSGYCNKLVKVLPDLVQRSDFSVQNDVDIGQSVMGAIYNHPITTTNYTIELSGYFQAQYSGEHKFLINADNGALLQFGPGFSACGMPSFTGNFAVEVLGPAGGGGNISMNYNAETHHLSAGVLYPVKIITFNWGQHGGLRTSFVDPTGTEHFDLGFYVNQLRLEGPKSSESVPTSATPSNTHAEETSEKTSETSQTSEKTSETSQTTEKASETEQSQTPETFSQTISTPAESWTTNFNHTESCTTAYPTTSPTTVPGNFSASPLSPSILPESSTVVSSTEPSTVVSTSTELSTVVSTSTETLTTVQTITKLECQSLECSTTTTITTCIETQLHTTTVVCSGGCNYVPSTGVVNNPEVPRPGEAVPPSQISPPQAPAQEGSRGPAAHDLNGSSENLKGSVENLNGSSDNPKEPSDNPKGPSDSPKGPSDSPKGPSDNPKGPSGSPKGPSDSPKGPSDSPKGPSDSPKGPSDSPKESPKNASKNPTGEESRNGEPGTPDQSGISSGSHGEVYVATGEEGSQSPGKAAGSSTKQSQPNPETGASPDHGHQPKTSPSQGPEKSNPKPKGKDTSPSSGIKDGQKGSSNSSSAQSVSIYQAMGHQNSMASFVLGAALVFLAF